MANGLQKWYVVAAFAVMKAGGAFVPLDPSHPIPRLQSLAHKLEASILLTSGDLAEQMSEVVATVVQVDEDSINSLPALPESTGYVSRCEPRNAAYVIFTSGSTGEPKVNHA